ncbi:MAG TPA: putative lateral flagellar export/assembly protein LafU [Scandinavium sp.]|jgi:chemotaxis protein MotB|uniref:putative lateral flagellar export/assembly protein LafU n=1 Tax=Scandinavium sp. TaxID=2830653 RepID=UPI002E321A06|nr:putative lateral flagellar export/assembly protein LafU [Scandinavium sp.]HEX4500515.1 putative lateral flagellar export/assembly protein LafU [Scandinavium sp.]
MRNNEGHTTIIKRSSRKGHHAHHGGAWKVAFADFTLAMMALFMVLWIMGAIKQEKTKSLIESMEGSSVFNGNNISPVSQEFGSGAQMSLMSTNTKSNPLPPKPRKDIQSVNVGKVKLSELLNTDSKSKAGGTSTQRYELDDLARIIMRITDSYHAQSNLQIDIVPQGLRILITDDNKREMFQRGSAKITPFFYKLLNEFAPALNKVDNKIMITGHTDATPYKNGKGYNNWNLSGERALQARSVLAESGLASGKIIQVSGLADGMLFDEKNPLSSVNRRIEIMVLTHSASDALYQFFGSHGEKVIKPITEKIAQGK